MKTADGRKRSAKATLRPAEEIGRSDWMKDFEGTALILVFIFLFSMVPCFAGAGEGENGILFTPSQDIAPIPQDIGICYEAGFPVLYASCAGTFSWRVHPATCGFTGDSLNNGFKKGQPILVKISQSSYTEGGVFVTVTNGVYGHTKSGLYVATMTGKTRDGLKFTCARTSRENRELNSSDIQSAFAAVAAVSDAVPGN